MTLLPTAASLTDCLTRPADIADRKLTSDEEEARRIAEMGKPVLGEHSKLEVIIEESYEFKVGDERPRSHRRRPSELAAPPFLNLAFLRDVTHSQTQTS